MSDTLSDWFRRHERYWLVTGEWDYFRAAGEVNWREKHAQNAQERQQRQQTPVNHREEHLKAIGARRQQPRMSRRSRGPTREP